MIEVYITVGCHNFMKRLRNETTKVCSPNWNSVRDINKQIASGKI